MTRPSGLGLGGAAALAGALSVFACDGSIACKAGDPAAIANSGAQYDDRKIDTNPNFVNLLFILVDQISSQFAADTQAGLQFQHVVVKDASHNVFRLRNHFSKDLVDLGI